MSSFEENLKKVLALYEKTGSLEATIENLNLSSEQAAKLQAAFAYLEKIDESAKSLQDAKERGRSTQAWQIDRIDAISEEKGCSDEKMTTMLENLNEGAEIAIVNKVDEPKLNKE